MPPEEGLAGGGREGNQAVYHQAIKKTHGDESLHGKFTGHTTLMVSYRYDALGRRVQKTVNGDSSTFVLSGAQVIEERDSNGDLLREFIYGSSVDEPLAMIADEQSYYYHANHRYSVAAITKQNGSVIERYAYKAYGQWVVLDANGNEKVDQTPLTPYGYTGRRFDSETGMWFFRARYFDSELGRFIGRNKLGYFFGDGPNPYIGLFASRQELDPSGLPSTPVGNANSLGYNQYINNFMDAVALINMGAYLAGNSVGGHAMRAVWEENPRWRVRNPIRDEDMYVYYDSQSSFCGDIDFEVVGDPDNPSAIRGTEDWIKITYNPHSSSSCECPCRRFDFIQVIKYQETNQVATNWLLLPGYWSPAIDVVNNQGHPFYISSGGAGSLVRPGGGVEMFDAPTANSAILDLHRSAFFEICVVCIDSHSSEYGRMYGCKNWQFARTKQGNSYSWDSGTMGPPSEDFKRGMGR